MDLEKKKVIKKYVFVFFICVIILITAFIMVRYYVEGEENMPFKLDRIIIRSSIDSSEVDKDNLLKTGLSQENDIFIYIAKENNADKKIKISKVEIQNIKITKASEKYNYKVFLPVSNNISTMYKDSSKDYLKEKIEYLAGSADSSERHIINEDGGRIAFRISNQSIGSFELSKDNGVTYNGELLTELGIKEEELAFNVYMELIIETTEGIRYKTELDFDMPADKFGKSSTKSKTITDFTDVIFKRE